MQEEARKRGSNVPVRHGDKEDGMSKRIELDCGAVVPGCEFVAHGETPADVLAKLAEHGRAAHGIEHLSASLKARIMAMLEAA